METVEADFECTIILHTCMAEVGTKMANRCTEDPRGTTYARKKVVMYTNFSNEAQKMYSNARADAHKLTNKQNKSFRLYAIRLTWIASDRDWIGFMEDITLYTTYFRGC